MFPELALKMYSYNSTYPISRKTYWVKVILNYTNTVSRLLLVQSINFRFALNTDREKRLWTNNIGNGLSQQNLFFIRGFPMEQALSIDRNG